MLQQQTSIRCRPARPSWLSRLCATFAMCWRARRGRSILAYYHPSPMRWKAVSSLPPITLLLRLTSSRLPYPFLRLSLPHHHRHSLSHLPSPLQHPSLDPWRGLSRLKPRPPRATALPRPALRPLPSSSALVPTSHYPPSLAHLSSLAPSRLGRALASDPRSRRPFPSRLHPFPPPRPTPRDEVRRPSLQPPSRLALGKEARVASVQIRWARYPDWEQSGGW